MNIPFFGNMSIKERVGGTMLVLAAAGSIVGGYVLSDGEVKTCDEEPQESSVLK